MKSVKDIPWECGKGWWPMIERVASAIDSFNATHPETPVEVSQIKQKFGGLRIYHYNAPEDLRQLIDEAVAASWHTCEKCGSTAGVTTNLVGVMQTLCPECKILVKPRTIRNIMNKELQKLLTERLMKNGKPFHSALICPPSDEQISALKEGDGHPESEMQQINSSAGLAVNFWRAYELCHPGTSVVFEKKMMVPIKRGRAANIDVVVRDKDGVTFIESKFLEPYYSENETPRNAYLDASRYFPVTQDFPQACVELFKKARRFKYYNVSQLCRHLLAISNDMWNYPDYYKHTNVKLCSVTWEMSVDFAQGFDDNVQAEFAARRKTIQKEAQECELLLNDFIFNHLPFPNLVFETVNYNDIIGQIDQSPYYSRIKECYYL